MTARLLLAAPPFAGHLNPLLMLGMGLRDAGFDIEVATGATKTSLVEGLGFRAHPLIADDPGIFDAIADTPRPVRSNPILLTKQLRANLALLPRARRDLDAILRGAAFDAVVADFTAPVAGYAAQAIGVPWLTTMPTPFALETTTGTPSYCGGWGPATRGWHRVRDSAGRRATRLAKRGMQAVLAGAFREAGTGVYRGDGSEAAYSPTAILGLGMSEVEFPRDWPQTFTMVGPVTGTPERVLPTAAPPPRLPRGPLVLITIGTHLHWARRDLIAQVAALASRVRSHTFVLTLGQVGASLPSDLPGSRVHIVDHMPYDEVLPACDAVIHHGGAGITYSAIRAGVPALVQPRDYDQFDFAARITASGAGVRIRHPLGHPATAAALTTLLRADRSRLQALTTAIRGYDPVAATAAIVNREIRR